MPDSAPTPDWREHELFAHFQTLPSTPIGVEPRFVALPAGTWLDLEENHLVLLMDGKLELYGDRVGFDRMCMHQTALNLSPSYEMWLGPHLRVRARKDCHFYLMDRGDLNNLLQDQPAMWQDVFAAMDDEVRHLTRKYSAFSAHLDAFFYPGNAGIIPGPYNAAKSRAYMFLLQGAAQPERPPRGLYHPPSKALRGLVMLGFVAYEDFVCLHEDGRHLPGFAPNEAAVFQLVWGPRALPSVFVREVYPDSYLAIVLGRELYGFPKRFGRVGIYGQNRYIDLVVEKRPAVDVGWMSETTLSLSEFSKQVCVDVLGESALAKVAGRVGGAAAEAWFGGEEDWLCRYFPIPWPVYVQHRLPRINTRKALVYEKNRLMAAPFRMWNVRDAQKLEGVTLTIQDPAWANTMGIGPTPTVIGAYSVDLGFYLAGHREKFRYDRLEPLRYRVHRSLDWLRYLASWKGMQPPDPPWDPRDT